MRSRSGIESAFISRSWRSLVQPRMGRQFIAWRRQPQGIPNGPTIILSPRGGGRGNSRQGRRWCRVARADRDSQVSALGVGLRSGAPFRCTHRIAHRKRGPLSTRTLRCTLPFQLSMALVAFFLPTASFGFQKQRTAPVCMILMIFLEAAREQEQSKPPQPLTSWCSQRCLTTVDPRSGSR